MQCIYTGEASRVRFHLVGMFEGVFALYISACFPSLSPRL